jgi:hypothetical protein
MMTTIRLAAVDLEGVVANCDARLVRAKAIADAAYDEELWPREYANVFWRAVFDSEQVHLDTLMEGVREGLEQLQQEGYTVLLYSSRPEAMRAATEEWLAQEHITSHSGAPFPLLLKAPAFQYVKTPVWWVGMLQTLVATGKGSDLVIVDDEEVRHQELARYSLPCAFRWYWNLQLAEGAEASEETGDEEPF